jgi:hypothetical protein
MCDGCDGSVSITRVADGKERPLHQSATGRLFMFETYPVFKVVYLRLERT